MRLLINENQYGKMNNLPGVGVNGASLGNSKFSKNLGLVLPQCR